MNRVRSLAALSLVLAGLGCGDESSSAPGGAGPSGSASSDSGGAGGAGGAGGQNAGTAGTGGTSCGDLESDPENCGECDHSCMGGECAAGKCQPVELATDEGQVLGLAIDDSAVYWGSVELEHVMRCALPGCFDGPTLVASGNGEVTDVHVDGTHVYFGDRGSGVGSVRKCALPDCAGGPVDMSVGLGSPDHLALTNLAVYWGDTLANQIAYCALSRVAIPPVVLSLGEASTVDLVLGNEQVLWSVAATTPGTGAIRGCYLPDCPGATLPVVEGLDDPGRLASNGTSVFWADQGTTISSCSLPDCASGPLPVREGLAALSAMAIHGSRLYYLAGGVHVCDLPDCTLPAKIADAPSSPGVLVASGAIVAWAQDGVVSMIAAP